ncbi:MAG: hypothetical protein KGJ41_02670 [Rhodospirillales bacterium]|nr:hypothetical protein [Rhodospirillales bacterium]MDE2197900.1 hypothetical protein [Rhodospirillales bacterium]MDE2575536.1 hypothetical protein [Rhodospirillales bacterium]
MIIDLTQVVQVLLALSASALTASVPYVAPAIRRYLHVSLSADQARLITQAAGRGAGIAYAFLASNDAAFSHVEIRNVALAKGVNHVLASFPDALAQLGVTPAHVQSMVEAELGRLLAADPSVKLAAGAAAVAAA